MDFTADEIATLLEDAADLLFRDGWCQKKLSRPGVVDGRETVKHCAIGAVNHWGSAGQLGRGLPRLALEAVGHKLGFKPGRGDHVAAWNDAKTRTAEEVIDVLRRTAKDVRNGDIKVAYVASGWVISVIGQ